MQIMCIIDVRSLIKQLNVCVSSTKVGKKIDSIDGRKILHRWFGPTNDTIDPEK